MVLLVCFSTLSLSLPSYSLTDAYTFEPISATAANTQILTIDRVKGDVTVKRKFIQVNQA